MFVTFRMSKWLISKLSKELHPSNMRDIFVTLEVLKYSNPVIFFRLGS